MFVIKIAVIVIVIIYTGRVTEYIDIIKFCHSVIIQIFKIYCQLVYIIRCFYRAEQINKLSPGLRFTEYCLIILFSVPVIQFQSNRYTGIRSVAVVLIGQTVGRYHRAEDIHRIGCIVNIHCLRQHFLCPVISHKLTITADKIVGIHKSGFLPSCRTVVKVTVAEQIEFFRSCASCHLHTLYITAFIF